MGEAEHTERSSDTRAAIMEATYRALCSHGYADLTMQSIADEFEKSKAAIHYHYDTKEDLLAAFLEYLLDRFVARLRGESGLSPEERIEAIVDALLFDLDDPDADRDLHTAMLEIRAQAPHRASFREQFTTNHALVEDLLVEAITEGIEQGVFEETDARGTARLVLATMLGGRVYDLTLDDRDVATDVRESLETSVLGPLRRSEHRPEGERSEERREKE